MKRFLSITGRHFQSLLTSFLLVGLLFSSSPLTKNVAARNPATQEEGESGPTSVRRATTLLRNYALTTVPVQRTASDISQQHTAKRSITYGGLARIESGVPATAVHHLLVTTDRSVLYLSFRLSRPGGRAPPAWA